MPLTVTGVMLLALLRVAAEAAPALKARVVSVAVRMMVNGGKLEDRSDVLLTVPSSVQVRGGLEMGRVDGRRK